MTLRRIAGWGAAAIVVALAAAFAIAYATSRDPCAPATGAGAGLVRAIVHCRYGGPDVLRLEGVARCVPGDDQLLVRVRAASVNPLDWHGMRGTPYLARLVMGLRYPKDPRIGVDFAGTVEAVGGKVTRFKPGDEVFGGAGTGAFAEYVCVAEHRAAAKPARVGFEEAAALPVAGISALQALRDGGKLQQGQKVLINGASGGVGTFAVQIAKSLGATVTGVCSTRNVELVRSLGADGVIDYTREDFTKTDEKYDVILDNVANRSLSALRRVLKPGGRYVVIGGGTGRWIDPLPRVVAAWAMSRFVSQDMRFFLAHMDGDDLGVLAGLVDDGKVKPVIDRRYPFAEVAEAIRYLEGGHARAKVLVTVDAPSGSP
jgi:NADPH:quinone reductase-like Zn-dependent oxidoreductase